MDKKREVMPILTASVIALIVTGVVRWILPGGTVIKQQPLKKELSLPDIPLMAKETKKKTVEIQVLVTKNPIKKDEKIVLAKTEWKKWPADALQGYFIAKDNKGTPLNNGADFANAQKMWAKNDIPAGIPLVMAMLTDADPQKILLEQKKKKEAEEKKLKEKQAAEKKKQANDSGIKPGYRAVTFSIDQKAPVSSSMIKPGQLIDIIIEENAGGKTKTHTYTAVKIIAVDGKTQKDIEAEARNRDSGGFSLGSITSFGNPKNITLEIHANMVNTMLKQAGNQGVLLSLRNQDEADHKDALSQTGEEDPIVRNMIVKQIESMNKSTAADKLMDIKKRKIETDRDISLLLKNLHSSAGRQIEMWKRAEKYKDNGSSAANGGKYEIMSGRIVGNIEQPQEDKTVVRIFRKLESSEIEFDKTGKKSDSKSSSSSSGVSRDN